MKTMDDQFKGVCKQWNFEDILLKSEDINAPSIVGNMKRVELAKNLISFAKEFDTRCKCMKKNVVRKIYEIR